MKFQRFEDGWLALATDRHGHELARFATKKGLARKQMSALLKRQNASVDGRLPEDLDIKDWRSWATSMGARPVSDIALHRGTARALLLSQGWQPCTEEELTQLIEGLS